MYAFCLCKSVACNETMHIYKVDSISMNHYAI